MASNINEKEIYTVDSSKNILNYDNEIVKGLKDKKNELRNSRCEYLNKQRELKKLNKKISHNNNQKAQNRIYYYDKVFSILKSKIKIYRTKNTIIKLTKNQSKISCIGVMNDGKKTNLNKYLPLSLKNKNYKNITVDSDLIELLNSRLEQLHLSESQKLQDHKNNLDESLNEKDKYRIIINDCNASSKKLSKNRRNTIRNLIALKSIIIANSIDEYTARKNLNKAIKKEI